MLRRICMLASSNIFGFARPTTQCHVQFTATLAILERKSAGWSGSCFVLLYKMSAPIQADLYSHGKPGCFLHSLAVRHYQAFILHAQISAYYDSLVGSYLISCHLLNTLSFLSALPMIEQLCLEKLFRCPWLGISEEVRVMFHLHQTSSSWYHAFFCRPSNLIVLNFLEKRECDGGLEMFVALWHWGSCTSIYVASRSLISGWLYEAYLYF